MVAQSYHEFDTMSVVVAASDPELSERLRRYSDIARYEGVGPESTTFIGETAVKLLNAMESARFASGLHGLHAGLMLEDAVMVDDTEDLVLSPDMPSDMNVYFGRLADGPHSAVGIQHTGSFHPAQQWLAESRRMPPMTE